MVGITVTEDADLKLSAQLELNNIMLERELIMAQLLERLSMGSTDPQMTNPSERPPAGIAHNHYHDLLLNLDVDSHPQYYNALRHADDPHSALSRVTSLKKSGSDALTGDVTLIPGSNVTLTQNTEQKTITIAASGGGGGVSFDDTSKDVGQVGGTSNTSASWQYLNGYVVVYRPILLEAVIWTVRNAGDYTLTIRDPDSGDIIAESVPKTCPGGTTQEQFDIDDGPVELTPGLWHIRLTKDGAAVTWRDARSGQPHNFSAFSLTGGDYNGSSTSYAPPIVLRFYDSTG